MRKVQFLFDGERPKILCLGAHADDIEIGCGGTILKLVQTYPEADFHWVVFSADLTRTTEARDSMDAFLANSASKTLDIYEFKDSYFPYIGESIKDCFVSLKEKIAPDLIFTHYSNDAHQDHRLIAELTWNAFRDNLIFEYEIPKYDADLRIPNFYVHLDEKLVKSKVSNLCKVFRSQHDKEWFGADTFRSIMRIRGLESNSPSKYAEAFHVRKMVI
jgi:LmbE family N-acetylglucosaminyl deacetylase